MVAKNPDPNLKLTSSKGVTRTLDDWSTMFHLCLVILPPRPEAAVFIPIARSASSRCSATPTVAPRTASSGNEFIAAVCSATAENECLTFVDPDAEFVTSLGLTHLPAFVHLRQDTTLVAAAEGWDPHEWQAVAKEVAKSMAWSVPRGRTARRSCPHAGLAALMTL